MRNGIYYNKKEKFYCAIQNNKILDVMYLCMIPIEKHIISSDYQYIKSVIPDLWLTYASILGDIQKQGNNII